VTEDHYIGRMTGAAPVTPFDNVAPMDAVAPVPALATPPPRAASA
jgi:hypothetical protein